MNNQNNLSKYIKLLSGIIDLSINICSQNENEKKDLRIKTLSLLLDSFLTKFSGVLTPDDYIKIKSILEKDNDIEKNLNEAMKFISEKSGADNTLEIYIKNLEEITKDISILVHKSVSPGSSILFDEEVNKLYKSLNFS